MIMATGCAKKLDRKRQPYLHITPSAVLVLVWNFLMYSYYILGSCFTAGFVNQVAPATWYKYGLVIFFFFGNVFFPFFGLLADVWIGRYKAILIGIVFFTVNIIQYNIDQLVGASADELNSVIYWHILSEPLVIFLFYLLQCLFYKTSGVSVSLVLVSHSFFKHKLENISLIKNPIKLIVRVLCYARKHKYPENRSALTYWEEEAPSRLDLGKDKYGGPFTEEEVEDVKTVFRMLPLFIGFGVINLCNNYYWSADESFTLPTCLAVTNFLYHISSVILIMLTRMSVGIFLSFIVTVSKVIIFVIERSHPEIKNFVSLEFTVAQSPVHMRGVMVGLWYTSWGIGYLINILLKFPFYLFVILAKRYKYRVRENEANIVQIVDDHYQRYMEQEEQYNRDRNDDIHY
uniref:Uncharacterized protein n=1 Tax=Amphimedon queenslandica TaxID=400682 RepID=A0A1X7TU03_AMPQE